MVNQKRLQEEAYGFPYHYLPSYSAGRFRQHQHWSWGYRYLGRLQVACDFLRESEFHSLIDVGCGDGRFLQEVDALFPAKRLVGIDDSDQAIALARRMNPALSYEHLDMLRTPPEEQFDVATLLEVIEHVPPDSLEKFIASVAQVLRPGGRLIITVPHTNVKVIAKHYQHFNSATLRRLLATCFSDLRFVPFDRISWTLRSLVKLMGGAGKYYIVTHTALSSALFRYYLKHCLYGVDESRCQRIACVARKTTPKPG